MGFGMLVVVAVVVVLVLGLVIFALLRRNQRTVPAATQRFDARQDRVVAVDDQGQTVKASQEGEETPRDDAAFDAILKDEVEELEGR